MGKWEMVRLGDVSTGKVTNIAQKDLSDNEGEYPIYGASGLIKHVDFYREEQPYIGVVKDGAGVGRTALMPAKSSLIGTMQYILPNETVNVGYLYYAISKMNLARFFTGATIPHIYYKDYKNEQMPLPPMDVQIKITNMLDRVAALIEKRKVQIEKMDLLVKSQFVEMFGDFAVNPKEFAFTQLCDVAEIVSGVAKGRKLPKDGIKQIPYMRVANVKDGYIDLFDIKHIEATEVEMERYRLKYNDVLLTEGGDPDKLGRGAIWKNKIEICIHQNHVFRVRLNKNVINPVFFAEYLKHPKAKKYFLSCAKQTTGIASINMTQLKLTPTPLPPLFLQRRFVNFVHAIDKSKSELQQGLNKLELLYKSLMQKCFDGEMF